MYELDATGSLVQREPWAVSDLAVLSAITLSILPDQIDGPLQRRMTCPPCGLGFLFHEEPV